MENKSGLWVRSGFTGTDTASAYRVAVGESESNNTQTALTGTTYSETVNAKYLRISTDGFAPAPATPYGFFVSTAHLLPQRMLGRLCLYCSDSMIKDQQADRIQGYHRRSDSLKLPTRPLKLDEPAVCYR